MSVVILIALTFLLAGLVKGVIGLGLPTVAIGLLSLVMAPAHAAALLIVPSLVTNVWQLLAGPRFGGLLRRLWAMMVGICVGTWAGAGLLTADTSGRAVTGLGLALIVYAGVGLASVRLAVPRGAQPLLSPLIGAATGLVSAATGVFVIPAAPYLQALALDKEDLIQALGLSFTVSTLALAVSLGLDGAFQPAIAGMSLLALAPALGGMLFGQWVRARVRPAVFRVCFFVGLLALGAHLALHTLI
ncbi:MAG: sulfite exporter TauE/SafE family protein [Pseudomonadota bacterium]